MAYFYLFKQLWQYAGTHRWKVAVMAFLHVISLSANIFTPYVFAQILNTLQTANRDEIMGRVTRWALVWIGLSLWFNLFHRLARYFEFDAAFRAQKNFTMRHYNIITGLPLAWHADHHSGDTLNRLNMAASALNGFGTYQFVAINNIVSFWGPLIALSLLSWKIAVLALIMALVSIAIVAPFDRKMIGLYEKLNGLQHKLSAMFFDYVSNIRTIITLRVAHATAHELDRRIEQTHAPMMTIQTWVNAWKWFIVSASTMLVRIGVVFYYVWLQLAKSNTILVGNAAAVFQYLQQFTDTYVNIARDYQQMIQWRTNFMAALPILAAQTNRPHDANILSANWQTIALDHVTFGYQPDRLTLDEVSLTVTRGEKIALIGSSGAGKSSLMNVLRGLHQPTSGTLAVDGAAQADLAGLYQTTTLIPQDPEIFENTVRFNVTMGLDATPEAIATAIRLARFDDVLARLPQGLDTDMREKGVTLSGGEKQRLALARGLLAALHSTIILMDEPTSSVDMANEKLIYANVFAAFAKVTIISSVHRLSLLPLFDRIIVMADGRIVESGTYAELTRSPDGHFARLLKTLETDAEDIA